MLITLIAPTEDLVQYDIPALVGIGPKILAACLKQGGHEARLIFLPKKMGDSFDVKVLQQVADICSTSDLIGISLLTDDLANAMEITSHLKKGLSVPILWGGVHPTVRPRECLHHADMVCIGEGEVPLIELADKMQRGEDITQVRSIWMKRDGKIIENELQPLIENLDLVPFQDPGPENHFVLWEGNIQRITEDLLRENIGRCYFTLSSRGCPFQCTYCFNHTYRRMFPNKKPIRKRSVDNLLSELVSLVRRFPFTEKICLDDDAFFLRDLKEIEEFSERYRKDVNVPLWIAGAGPTMVRPEKLAALAGAGMRSMRMGIQTGSDRIKRLYKRTFSNKQVLQAAKMINAFKTSIPEVQYDFIIDNPWETEKDVVQSLRLASRLPVPHELRLFPLHFYPGTDLYEKAQREGVMSSHPNEVWLTTHHRFRDIYVNRVFLLAYEYTRKGSKIGPFAMHLLTNFLGRKIKVSQLFYLFLLWSVRGEGWARIRHLVGEGWCDLRRGRWERIARTLQRNLSDKGDGVL